MFKFEKILSKFKDILLFVTLKPYIGLFNTIGSFWIVGLPVFVIVVIKMVFYNPSLCFFAFLFIHCILLFILTISQLADYLYLKSMKKKESENVELIKILKFNPEILDEHNEAFVKRIIETININEKNNEGQTILSYIANISPSSLYIPLLINCGADPYIIDNNNKSILEKIEKYYKIVLVKNEKNYIENVLIDDHSSPDNKKRRM